MLSIQNLRGLNQMKNWHIELMAQILILGLLFVGLIFSINQMDKQTEKIKSIYKFEEIR